MNAVDMINSDWIICMKFDFIPKMCTLTTIKYAAIKYYKTLIKLYYVLVHGKQLGI